MLAYYEMFARDRARFAECRERCNVLPLGSGPGGHNLPIDRAYVAKLLRFPGYFTKQHRRGERPGPF
jgi:argininosuccinate lyase